MRRTALSRLCFVVAISMRDAGLNVGQRVLFRFRLLGFFGCVFSHAFSGFASGCLICSALPWVLNCLGWAFTPGVIRLRFGCVWALTWVMPPRTIIYYLPKTFNKTLLMGKRGLGDRPGREVGDSVLPHGERLHFGIFSVSRFERFLCLYAVGVGLIRLRVVVGRFCSFLTVFCFACLLEMLIAGLGVLQGRYGCISYSG